LTHLLSVIALTVSKPISDGRSARKRGAERRKCRTLPPERLLSGAEPTHHLRILLVMFKRTSSFVARLRQQAETCMQIASLMSNRQQAKALRKQAEELFARAEKLEKGEVKKA
jgi:hypothetical protein